MPVKYKENKTQIYAPLKDIWLEARPEEVVRQEFIDKLVSDYGYCLEQMAQEMGLTSSKRGDR